MALSSGGGGGGGGGSSGRQNQPPSFDFCPYNITVQAARGEMKAQVNWTEPEASDPGGGPVSLNQTQGEKSGSWFNEGQHKVVYVARDEAGLPAYCSFTITVTVTYCPRQQNIPNGRVTCSRANVFGSTCSYQCDLGYELNEAKPASKTCEENGIWNPRTDPSCEPVSCAPPGTIPGGNLVCYGGHEYGRSCVAACDRGYTISPGLPIHVTCQADRNWTQPTPHCTDVQPPNFPHGCPPDQKVHSLPLEAPVPVTWTDPVATDSSGGNVTLECDHENGGVFSTGIHVIKCTATDNAGNHAACRFSVQVTPKQCRPPLPPSNGRLSCTKNYVEGSECATQCNDGYQLEGNTTVTCLGDGQWDTIPPNCKASVCGQLPEVSTGSFVCYNGHEFHAVCRLECLPGYAVRGLPHTQCLANGSWSNAGYCHDSQPPVFVDGCPKNVEVYGERMGVETNASWVPPTVSDNSQLEVQLSSDHIPGDTFPPGVTSVTYTATDISGNSRRCTFSVIVTTLSCGIPNFQPHTICDDGAVFGATCRLGCSNGFPLKGADMITCERIGDSHPPIMQWVWESGSKPVCLENECPDLPAPANGALTCHLGNFGWDCLMSCNEKYDVPASVHNDGHFYCTNSAGYWTPEIVPNCTRRINHTKPRLMSALFYYTGSCNEATDELRENFITRINNSTILKDICASEMSCLVEHIKVTCGPTDRRRRRDTENGGRTRRNTEQYEVEITFDISVDFHTNYTSSELWQRLESLKRRTDEALKQDANNGLFNIGDLVADQYSFAYPTIGAECPPGTMFIRRHQTTALSCAGCGAGYYLSEGSTQCEACPVGSYTELDNATSCTPCPPGWSTPTTGSKNSSDCRQLCTAGRKSLDGFSPCQPCPPGEYQTHERATSCDSCPVGTWTSSSAATSVDDCVAADIHLKTDNLLASVSGGWSNLTVSAWCNLKPNTSVNVTIQSNSTAEYHLILHSDDNEQTSTDSETSAVLAVQPDTWSRLLIIMNAEQSSVNVYHQDALVRSFTQVFTGSSPYFDIAFESVTGEAVLSGLHASDNVEDPTMASAQSCQKSTDNLLAWSPFPSTLYVPSKCDAVDDCLDQPCGLHPCENQPNGFVCHCRDGWSGDTCSTPPDPCYNNDCRDGSTCLTDADGDGYSCVCQSGFAGLLCNLTVVAGGWGDWSPWSDCSESCGGGQQQRQRLCNNPPPLNGGDDCSGPATERMACGVPDCPVHGNWNQWEEWNGCSATCGGGERTRRRLCNSPSPQFDGDDCDGVGVHVEVCNNETCPVHGGFGAWSDWTACSLTCGEGFTTRERSCDSPVPAYGGDPCTGHLTERVQCNLGACPECAPLSPDNTTQLKCNETYSPFLRTCKFDCKPGYVSPTSFPLYFCGEETAYTWSNWSVQLPSCSEVTPVLNVTLNQSITINEGVCQGNTEREVMSLVKKKMAQLPCQQHGICTVEVEGQCDLNGRLTLSTKVDVRLDKHFSPTDDDKSKASKYQAAVMVTKESFENMTNGTERMYSGTANGRSFTPNLESRRYNGYLHCPPGQVPVDGVCGECPKGYREEHDQCVECPFEQYQDQRASTECKPCPEGLSSEFLGATSVRQCNHPIATPTAMSDHSTTTQLLTAYPEMLADNTVTVVVSVVAVLAVLTVAAVIVVIWLRRRPREIYGAPQVPGFLDKLYIQLTNLRN